MIDGMCLLQGQLDQNYRITNAWTGPLIQRPIRRTVRHQQIGDSMPEAIFDSKAEKTIYKRLMSV